MKFNCENCLIKACCSKICKPVLNDTQTHLSECINNGVCPDCGSKLGKFLKNRPYKKNNVKCVNCNHEFISIKNKYARIVSDNFYYNGKD